MTIETSTRHGEISVRPDRGERPADRAGAEAVPWKSVAALSVVLSFGDGIWLTALHGAIGAIERTEAPSLSWLQESTALAPLYAVGVLAAMTLAGRWSGPEPPRRRNVIATALLVALVGTAISLAVSGASSVYDYRLQSQQLAMMDSMRSRCIDSCLDTERHATLALHLRSLVYLSRWLLLTNVVLVGWLCAVCGGRLRLRTTARTGASGRARAADVRMLLVGSLLASAAVHAAVVPEHLTEWPTAGMALILLAIWELAVAGLLFARIEERTILLAAAAVSAGPLALWLTSRTVGLPFGPEPGAAEAIGPPDLAAWALEVVSLLAAVALLRGSVRLRRPPLPAQARSLIALTLVAVTVIGVAAAGLPWFDAFGVADVRSVTGMGH